VESLRCTQPRRCPQAAQAQSTLQLPPPQHGTRSSAGWADAKPSLCLSAGFRTRLRTALALPGAAGTNGTRSTADCSIAWGAPAGQATSGAAAAQRCLHGLPSGTGVFKKRGDKAMCSDKQLLASWTASVRQLRAESGTEDRQDPTHPRTRPSPLLAGGRRGTLKSAETQAAVTCFKRSGRERAVNMSWLHKPYYKQTTYS